ncbi:MAG TPA: arginine--tRNA ligase [Candidatus Xenobia bacterium]|nr:arginine--tRNA ligase [Candidatus Xenobia bacterium]
MLQKLHRALQNAVRAAVKKRYGIEVDAVVLERPPQTRLGDLASPLPFELARTLKRAPRQIAAELAESVEKVEGVERAEAAGGGYLNFHFQRGAVFSGVVQAARRPEAGVRPDAPKVIVEHTNINPNKAAHIGHLRNAVLGDVFVRLLRFASERVEVQNYIDNTGVQVADVVVGFEHLEKKSVAEVEKLAKQVSPRLDYYCWDLYARVTQFFEEDPKRLELRARALKAIEEGEGETARLAELVATTIVRCHLSTMERLGVEYDLLPRESEILHLKFWEAAFEQLKQRGAIEFAESGKNQGCWVMRLTGGDAGATDASGTETELDEAKIIVRSNGTVTYVGKDIAYQLWKFGLLHRTFAYRRFHTYPNGHTVWMTAVAGEPDAPAFGGAHQVYNVIDSRQSYLQNIVAAGVRALGYAEQADRSVHFAYEMVGLTPRCARELGVELAPEDEKRPFVEVSGRKGQGVKADDLLDALEEVARREVAARQAELPAEQQAALAHKIAVAALRFFLLRFTRNTPIAFDFKDALNFDGETGPYLQYSVVRARNIFRKLREAEPDYDVDSLPERVATATADAILAPEKGDDLWELVMTAAELEHIAAIAAAQQEPALVAKWSFGLAQQFNLFYHRHHILSESDAGRKAFLLLLADLVERRLTRALGLMGIEVPERM